MPLSTSRVPGDTITAADVNGIATQVNTNETGVAAGVAALTAHEAAADPHAGYLTEASATATYGPKLGPIWRAGYYYGPEGGRTVVAHGTGALTYVPFQAPAGVTVDRIGCEVTTAAGGAVGRLGIYSDDGTGRPGTLLLDAGTVDASTTGAKEITISQALTTGGTYWLALVSQVASATFRCIINVGSLPTGAPSLSGATAADVATGWLATGITGALPTPATLGGTTHPPYLVAVRAV